MDGGGLDSLFIAVLRFYEKFFLAPLLTFDFRLGPWDRESPY